MASIVIPGLAANYPNPGIYEDIEFAVGPAAGSGSVRRALLIGNFLAAATATQAVIYGPDTSTPVQTEQDVITLFGAGSGLCWMGGVVSLSFTIVMYTGRPGVLFAIRLLTVVSTQGCAGLKLSLPSKS